MKVGDKEKPYPLICNCNPRPKSFGVMDNVIECEYKEPGIPRKVYLLHYDCQTDEVKALLDAQIQKQFPELVDEVLNG